MIYNTSIYNVSIRLGTLVLRFIFQFIAIKYLSISSFGELALILISSNLIIFLLGLEFYTYSTRRLNKGQVLRSVFITNHLFICSVSFLFSIPIIVLLFLSDILPYNVIYLFLVFIFGELLSNELFRIYISINNSIFGNIVFFIRNGLSSIVGIILLIYFKVSSIQLLLISFIFFSYLSVFIAFTSLRKSALLSKVQINFRWIAYGLRISSTYLLSGAIILVISNIDIYLLKCFHNTESVGVLTYFRNTTNVIQVILFSAITSVYLPKYLQTINSKDSNGERHIFSSIIKSTLILTTVVIILVYIGNYFIIRVLNRELLIYNFNLLFYLLLGSLFYSLSTIFNTWLYAHKYDNYILKNSLIILVVNLFLGYNIIPIYGIWGAGVVYMITNIIMLVLYYLAYRVKKCLI